MLQRYLIYIYYSFDIWPQSCPVTGHTCHFPSLVAGPLLFGIRGK